MDELTALKDRVCLELDAMRDSLGTLSRQIYENPEIGFEERKALQWVSAFLRESGFSVEPGTSARNAVPLRIAAARCSIAATRARRRARAAVEEPPTIVAASPPRVRCRARTAG